MTIVANNSITVSNVNDGTITHTAWSYSADGTDRFTTIYPNLNLLKGTKTPKSITGNNAVNQGGLLYSFDNNNTLVNQGFSVNDTITLEFDWSATNPSSGLFILQWQGAPWGFNVPNINVSSTNGSGHVIYTHNIRAADVDSTAVATGIGYRLDNIPTNTVITFSNVIIRKAKCSQPWMQSASEVTTADWPKYIGHYTDFMQADSTNPSDYTWGPMRGDDGVGIKTTVITYANSTSGTTAPSTGWTSSVPTLVKGQYLWTKTVWTYTDNSFETGYSVTYNSKDGTNGTNGTSGIIVSSVAPASPQTGQLWQDTSTTPQLVKKWTGNEWVIWELYVENMNVNNLSALSPNLGNITGGSYTSWFTEINTQNGYTMLNGIYLFNGRIRSLVIQSANTIDQYTVLGSGVLPTANGTEQYGGQIRYFSGAFNLGITPNQLLHDMETYGYWSKYDIAGTTGTSALVSEVIGYSDGISISGNVLVNNIPVESDWISMSKGRYKLAYSRVAIAFDITGAGESFVKIGVLPKEFTPPFDRWFSAATTGTTTADDRHVMVRASDGAVILWSPKSGTRYQSEISFTL